MIVISFASLDEILEHETKVKMLVLGVIA